MLVLSRKPGEQIQIGDKITVTLLSVEGKRVRLGFVAPPEVPILRKELSIELDRRERRIASVYATDSETEPIGTAT